MNECRTLPKERQQRNAVKKVVDAKRGREEDDIEKGKKKDETKEKGRKGEEIRRGKG